MFAPGVRSAVALAGILMINLVGQPLATNGSAMAQDGPQACDFDRIIDLRSNADTTSQRLLGEASSTQIVFLGETPGTPEHTHLASCLLNAKARSRPPVLALEYVPASAQSDLDFWRRESPFDSALFAELTQWDEGAGAPFAVYAPLIETAGRTRSHIIATDRPQPGAGGPSFASLVETAPPYGLQTDDIVEAWVPDLLAQQCDLVSEQEAQSHVRDQMERAQIMAGRLIAGRGRGPSTLFFGERDMVRKDRTLPYLTARTDRPPSMVVIGAFTQEEWSNLLGDGSVQSLGLAQQYDLVVIAGHADPGASISCAGEAREDG